MLNFWCIIAVIYKLAVIIAQNIKNQINMKNKIKIHRTLKLLFFAFICTSLSNCRLEENKKKSESFEQEFYYKIAENKAKKSSYQYDGLVPQNSYFIKSKLKYLKYTHEPENGTIMSLVYFNKVTDSLYRIIRRKTSYKKEDWKSERKSNYRDTIIEILFYNKKTYKYVDNKIVDSVFDRTEFKRDVKFITNMKLQTEKNYNYR